MDQIPHQKKIVDTSLGTQPSKFDRFLRSLKLEGTSKQIEGFQPDLKTAHRRLDQLKKSYKEGDPIWQDFLTKTSAGKRLILVFLGARPCAEFHDEELQRELGKMGYRFGPKFIEYLLRKNASNNFSVSSGEIAYKDGFIMVFSDDSVRKVFSSHPKHFRGYTPKLAVASYFEQLGKPPETSNEKEKDIQRGLLFNYPAEDIEGYSNHIEVYNKFLDLIAKYTRMMNDESYVFPENDQSIMENGGPLRQYFMSTDQNYRAKHRASIATIIEKYTEEFGVSEDAKQYILDYQVVTDWSGAHHIGNPNSKANKDFIQTTDEIVEKSGTNAFLRECGQGND